MATTEEVKPKKGANVYEKIFNIQQSISVVIKGGYNDFHKYKFARERDVVAEIKPLLGREGLVITHSLLKEEESSHGSTKAGAEKYLTKLTFRFRITNIKDPSDFVEADAIGYGQDGEDKGAPKAYTMALKYFLSKEFLIETGDDAEEDRGGKKKGDAAKDEQKFATAKRMVTESRNLDGLIEYQDNLKSPKSSFSAAQKKELEALLKARIAKLDGSDVPDAE